MNTTRKLLERKEKSLKEQVKNIQKAKLDLILTQYQEVNGMLSQISGMVLNLILRFYVFSL